MATTACSLCLPAQFSCCWDGSLANSKESRPLILQLKTFVTLRESSMCKLQKRAKGTNWSCLASAQDGQEEANPEEGSAGGGLAQVEQAKGGEVGLYEGAATKTGKGAVIADFLKVFGHLLERPYGGGESVAAAGAVVIERVVSDAQALRGQEGVKEQAIFEMLKVLRFLEMDMELVSAARKEETLLERLETAKEHCRQAFLIADAI